MLYYQLGPGVEAFTAGRLEPLPYPVIQGHQIHKDHIAVITPEFLGEHGIANLSFTSSIITHHPALEGFDAFITDVPGVAIGVRTADCVPILLFDPVHRAIAAIHSGWRSTVLRIAPKTLALMTERYGTRPSDVLAVIGPSISHASYQVGEEVIAQFLDAGFPDSCWTKDNEPSHFHLDLWSACRWLLVQAGIPDANIHVSGICTFRTPEYCSARREGNQHELRNINAIRLVHEIKC